MREEKKFSKMKPNKILVVRKMSQLEYYYNGNHKSKEVNDSEELHSQGVNQIKEILKKFEKEFDVVTRRELSEELVQKYGAVISAGGDGTAIAVAAYNPNVLQLNLRTSSKSVGGLCQKDIQQALESFLKGEYDIENWQRQDVYLDGKFVGRACNEVCVGERLRFDKLARYDLSYTDKENGLIVKERQGASGIIIATGTGSHAWPSAFTPHPRNEEYFQFRTLLLHSGKIEHGYAKEANIFYKGHEGKFSLDTIEQDFPADSKLEIKLSKNPLKIAIPRETAKYKR